MRHIRRAVCLVAVAMLAASAAEAWGRVESHTLGPDLPPHPMPGWVVAPPAFWTRQMEPVRPENAPAPSPASRNPLTMPDDARKAIRLAQDGQWAEAARLGQAVLEQPEKKINAYTRDYVANATAWALVHLNNRKRARQIHTATAAQMPDPAVAHYHRVAAVTLLRSTKRTEDLCDPTVYVAERRKHLAPRYKEFSKALDMAGRSEAVRGRLTQLRRAYGQLRLVYATDAELGRKVLQEQYRPAVDALLDTLAADGLKRGGAIRDSLNRAYKKVMEAESFPDWNYMVQRMWGEVATVKQLCRVHQHLARMGLATAGRARGPFENAHRLLFCQGASHLVWQPVGFARIVNGVSQKDIRRRVAWQETLVTPLGASASEHSNQSNQGWQRMGKMQKMTGDDWQKMDGDAWDKMDGDAWDKMDGDGWDKMDGDGWNKMDGRGWRR
ncbi:MAG: hypothetical protein R6X20_13535 [Phycisphaerae bacterium]